MKIRGAVLEEMGRERPYADSRPITVGELDLDGPGPTEILVRMEAAGVCHSDLSVVDGNRPRPMPMLLGHEAAGSVEKVGYDVEDIQVGDRVVMSFLPRCGECRECRTDGRLPCSVGSRTNNEGTLLSGSKHLTRDGETVHHHLGVSGFATHAVVDQASAVVVPEEVPPEVAAVLGCAVLTGGGAVLNAARPGPEDSIMIVGLGGVGMAALITALAQDVREVIAVDTLPAKLERARQLGAHRTFTPRRSPSRASPRTGSSRPQDTRGPSRPPPVRSASAARWSPWGSRPRVPRWRSPRCRSPHGPSRSSARTSAPPCPGATSPSTPGSTSRGSSRWRS